jgi:hypothetical protein
MDVGARDYMQGHVSQNEAEDYGDFNAKLLQREIEKMPRADLVS